MNGGTDAPALRGKQLELHQRDERVLALAQSIFIDKGFQAVTIDAIARELGYSRGTLYQRFSCREELVLELAIRCHRQITAVMEHASRFPGRSRERVVAIGAAIDRYASLYTDNLRILAVIDSEMVREKAPPDQLQRLQQAQRAMLAIPAGLIEEAVAAGDLVLPPKATVGSLCMALAALISGWAQLHRRFSGMHELPVATSLEDILRSAHLLMDGFGWRPFFQEWDYEQTYQRVGKALLGLPTLNTPTGEQAARGKEVVT